MSLTERDIHLYGQSSGPLNNQVEKIEFSTEIQYIQFRNGPSVGIYR